MLHRTLGLTVLLAPIGLWGCSSPSSGIFLTVRLGALSIDQLELRGQAESGWLAPAVRRPEQAGEPLPDPQTLLLLLPESLGGQTLELEVTGFRQQAVQARATLRAVVQAREVMTREVWLGSGPSDGGLEGRPADGPRDAGPVELGPECDPKMSPTCAGSTLLSCSASGKKVTVDCPYGCAAGACCPDQDQDGFSSCSGDCDDADGNAHPDQTAFFNVPSKGAQSFDYDCDKQVEMQFPDLEACVHQGSTCQGDGWSGAVPGCGAAGLFVVCKPSGRSGCTKEQSSQVQACR